MIDLSCLSCVVLCDGQELSDHPPGTEGKENEKTGPEGEEELEGAGSWQGGAWRDYYCKTRIPVTQTLTLLGL